MRECGTYIEGIAELIPVSVMYRTTVGSYAVPCRDSKRGESVFPALKRWA